MKNKLIIITHLLVFCVCFSQKKQNKIEITSDIAATYDVRYPVMTGANEEQAVLLMNTKNNESLFVGSNLYTLFQLQQKGKGQTLEEMLKYHSEVNEVVYRKIDTFWVGEQIIKYNFSYLETPILNWKITNEKKRFQNYILRKATVDAYGRSWEAWYIDDDFYINAGPYKFFNLPGLIAHIYDTKKQYEMSLTQLKKKKIYFSIETKGYKLLPNKKKFYETRYKIKTNPLQYGFILTADELKKDTEKMIQTYKKLPLWDISK